MENKSTLAKFIDNTFYCFAIIVISIVWCGYITNKLIYQIALGSAIGAFSYVCIKKLVHKYKSPKTLAKAEEKHKNECMATLSIANPNKVYQFFTILLDSNFKTQIEKPFLRATNKSTSKTFLIYFNFFINEFSVEALYNVLELSSTQNLKVVIFAKKFSNDCIAISNRIDSLCLLDANDSYLFFKEFNTFPKISEKIKEKRFQNLKRNIFSSINSKKFIKLSLLLIFLSFFTSLKKYYLIVASITFLFSLICYFSKSLPKKQSDFRDFVFDAQPE